MKKPTSTFWICASIIVAGIIIGGAIGKAIYESNRYEVNQISSKVIDKYTGESRFIK